MQIKPISSINTAEQLNDASGLNYIEININGIKVKEEYIQDFEIHYNGGFEIKGYFTINDIYDLQTQGFLNPGFKINVKYKDQHKDDFERDFIIVRSTELKIQDAKGIKFVVQDIVSWKLRNTFQPKSWEEVTLKEVFDYILSLEVQPLIPKIKRLGKPSTRKLKHFCVPLHVNFLDFITEEFRKEGTFFYQTKDAIVIGDYEPPETPQFPYTQVGKHDLYGFNIFEYYLTFNNINETNTVLPKTEFIAYDPSKKKVQEYKKSLPDYKELLKPSRVANNSQLTFGARHITQDYLLDTTKYKYYYYHNNTQLEIYVPGNVKYSELYKKVEVKLGGNINALDTRNLGDYKLSGKYIIYEVHDKIVMGNKFYQKLVLKRLSEEKK